MKKIKLIIAYDGSGYGGWQVQPNAPTIQAEVERGLAGVLGEKVRVHGSGRTDAGVHALGQVAHFETEKSIPPEGIRAGANGFLPPAIRLVRAEETHPDFHARYSARGKIYRYLVFRRRVLSPFYHNRACHYPYPLDRERMEQAAACFQGKHDFKALAAAGGSVKDTVRTVERIDISGSGELLAFEFEGDGFLYRMVRNLVSTILEAGRGKIDPAQIPAIIEGKDRRRAGPTAPAEGLYLVEVKYEKPE